MYKIIGSDGNQYGPVSLEQIRQWIAEGRVNAQTRVQADGATEWRTAAEFPEFELAAAAGASGAGSAPPALPSGPGSGQQNGLAITSLVLGLGSVICLGPLAGIPAIVCGHLARGRARRAPAQYGGAGFALAGLIMGYVSLLVTLVILPAMLLPALARAKDRAQRIQCANNMKQIGLAIRVWAIENEDSFPFNLSTNRGGTLELCLPGSDGFDRNTACHYRVMSNELCTPKILVCPADTKKQAAFNFSSLQPGNVSYSLCSGTNVSEVNPSVVLAICPIHNNVLLCDGSVQQITKSRRGARQRTGPSP
ncbi:MAG TPA: DUF4190 domain-containing protein [Verrucomicrobiota bacterium]|nr:DUF4190 domain-containing protein [Verrucomicrobiota bacterium]HQL77790.1 DUF4190 domain-containing protein [Verrucomicrobiota bacterium]